MRPLISVASCRLLIRNWKQKNQELFTTSDNSRSPLFIYLFIHLFIYLSFCHHAKSNTDFMFQVACFHLDFCVSSVYYLLYIACSSAPSKNFPPCTFKSKCLTLICIQFIHICFSSTSLINFASLLDNLDQMLLNKATIDPGAHVTDGSDWLLGLQKLNRRRVAYVPGRKLRMQTRARAGPKAR